jgi:uncharacterized protein YbjT (DUF2867 family)
VGRSALVLGATGLVGGKCVDLLLQDPSYSLVRVLVRRPSGHRGAGLDERVVDFDRLADHRDLFAVDDVFCCLGTTIRKAGSREAFDRVDVQYPAMAARLAAEAGAGAFAVVSAVGADSGSRIAYNRSKGEMEDAVRATGIRAWILRPALLLGDRAESRPGERFAELLMKPIAPLLVGPLRRLRPVHAEQVARAMINLVRSRGAGGVIESERIAEIAAR